jgi:hypothetical protein
MDKTCHCLEGWVCETHPEQPYPHDDCAGPGEPCQASGCPHRITGVICPNCGEPTGIFEGVGSGIVAFQCPCGHRQGAFEDGSYVTEPQEPE